MGYPAKLKNILVVKFGLDWWRVFYHPIGVFWTIRRSMLQNWPYLWNFSHIRMKLTKVLDRKWLMHVYSTLSKHSVIELFLWQSSGTVHCILRHVLMPLAASSVTVFQWGERIWENRGHQTSPSLPSSNTSQIQYCTTGTHAHMHMRTHTCSELGVSRFRQTCALVPLPFHVLCLALLGGRLR